MGWKQIALEHSHLVSALTLPRQVPVPAGNVITIFADLVPGSPRWNVWERIPATFAKLVDQRVTPPLAIVNTFTAPGATS